MQSTMMVLPLSTQMILRHSERIHGSSRVGTFDGEQFVFKSFAETIRRSTALARALRALGLGAGDRVATFCWNHQQHLEAYLAVPSIGCVLHTLNVRLLPEQIVSIMAHAQDQALIIDASLLPLIDSLLAGIETLTHVLVVGGAAPGRIGRAAALDFEAAVNAGTGDFVWPHLDENDAAVMCYTTGTTGDPKGVAYSHRTIFLHSLASLGVDTFGICERDRVLLLPSMFHANAWGLPYSCLLAGSDLLLPGAQTKAASIRRMIQQEKPTFTAMVPTLINDLLQEDSHDSIDMSSFRVLVSGGSPLSPGLIRSVRERWGVPVLQGWGMTETSPLCTLSHPPRGLAAQEEMVWRAKSGRPVPGVEVRIVDEAGDMLPENGTTVGELQLRGAWITGSYYKNASPASFTADGWLRTGDVGTIDERGCVQITDRVKDVIKSGGEWVSSVDLEGQLGLHSAVAEAAVIGIPDKRWEERPLALIVMRAGMSATPAELREFLHNKVARFWVPEYWAFVDALPRTSVGKIDKKALRKSYSDGALDVVTHPALKQ